MTDKLRFIVCPNAGVTGTKNGIKSKTCDYQYRLEKTEHTIPPKHKSSLFRRLPGVKLF